MAGVVGGGGGGRPNMAQAGGKNPEKIDEAVAKAARTGRADHNKQEKQHKTPQSKKEREKS